MKVLACRELGFRCVFVAEGQTSGDVDRDFWLHARSAHISELRGLSLQQKTALSQLVEDLAESSRLQSVVRFHQLSQKQDSGVSVLHWWR